MTETQESRAVPAAAAPAPDPGTDGAAEPAGPHRRCIVTGEVRPKEMLLRFVVGPDATVVPDLENALPGRGLWLSARRDMVETAMAKRCFARAARQKVAVPPDLADRIDALMRRRCLDRLGLARRAGMVTAGFEKVRALLKAERQAALVLLEAADGGADGRGKIRALAPDLPVVDLFTGAELGAALGRDLVVHAVVTRGPKAQAGLAGRLIEAMDRLARYRGGTSAGAEKT